MQAITSPVENSTVFVSSSTHNYRIWWNRNGCYWQTDIQTPEYWTYFGQAHSLIQAMTNIAITL